MLRSFAAVDFFVQGWLETEGILPYFKVENILGQKKTKAKPGFSLWNTAQEADFFCLFYLLLEISVL